MKRITILFVLTTIIMLSSFTELERLNYRIKTIVIDAGHGGKDPGCHGERSEEAEVALATALELERILKENMPDVNVIMTRASDHFVELHERAKIANSKGADLFISIHCNAGPTSAYGTETYTMGLHKTEGNLEVAKRENSVILKEENYGQNYGGYDPNSPIGHILLENQLNAFNENSLRLAHKIEHQFRERVQRNSRGVKQAGLLVLWKTTMPSVLVEIGFLTNKNEEQYLLDEEGRVLIASGIYRAVKEYKQDLESMEE